MFRNNTAQGWVGIGRQVRRTETVTLNPGDAVVRNARILHAGLMKGSADLVGWKTITITPSMVGRKVAVFTSCEVKTANGRIKQDQVTWRENVERAGGIAMIVRAADEVKRGITEWMNRFL